ncbi:MAG: hypothetical protein WD929_05840 [Steroidobacteraceae bacterium]
MKTLLRALALWLAAVPAMAEESPAARFFEQLAGHWQGTGEVRGMPSNQQMRWEAVLDGRFLRLSFDNRMSAPDGKEWRFQAEAYYRIQADGTIAGTWFDSRGVSFPLTGSVDESAAMTILWGTAETERGRSSYRISDAGLEVRDEVLGPDGAWHSFGRTTLTRLP